MRVVIATTQVPFVFGGAEIHAEELREAFRQAGHQAEIVAIPFKWYPAERILDHMLACRLLDLTESDGQPIDRVIGLKFPAYLVAHPCKVLWVLHQHRPAYDLWQHPSLCDLLHVGLGRPIRDSIRRADENCFAEAHLVYANSRNVADRLHRYSACVAEPLYHPPRNAALFYPGPPGDFLFFPSRITRIKRQMLVLEALAAVPGNLRVHFAGAPDDQPYHESLARRSAELGLAGRIRWLGHITEEEKLRQYAQCLGVIYPPLDEDYGYVTLEAMLAAKPVITVSDAGGAREFVRHERTGLVSEPTPEALAAAIRALAADPARARDMGEEGRALYDSLEINWETVVDRLLA